VAFKNKKVLKQRSLLLETAFIFSLNHSKYDILLAHSLLPKTTEQIGHSNKLYIVKLAVAIVLLIILYTILNVNLYPFI